MHTQELAGELLELANLHATRRLADWPTDGGQAPEHVDLVKSFLAGCSGVSFMLSAASTTPVMPEKVFAAARIAATRLDSDGE